MSLRLKGTKRNVRFADLKAFLIKEKNMENEVLDFIHRRFQKDCDWMNDNCYYFAVILLDRFPLGRIVYEPVDGHFLFQNSDGRYYDWTGERFFDKELIDWDNYDSVDRLHCAYIYRNCVK